MRVTMVIAVRDNFVGMGFSSLEPLVQFLMKRIATGYR